MKQKKQLKIRDFGHKLRFLIKLSRRSEECVSVECIPSEFPQFDTDKIFLSRLDVDTSTLNQWSDDRLRRCDYRLAPHFAQVVKSARIFGIWPRVIEDEENLLSFWRKHWPSWFSAEACEQFKNGYGRWEKDAEILAQQSKPDAIQAFADDYCKQLKIYAEDPAKSRIYFPISKEQQALQRQAINDVQALLEGMPEVLSHLKKNGLQALPWKAKADGDAIRNAAGWLLNADEDSIIQACWQTYLETGNDRSHAEVRATLVRLAKRLIPAIHDDQSIPKIISVLKEETKGLIVLPAYRCSLAELPVSAAEGRPVSYLARDRSSDWPIGARSFIDAVPDNGFDAQEQTFDDLKLQIAAPFTATNRKAISDGIRSFVSGSPFFEPEPGTEVSDDTRFKIACDNIRIEVHQYRKCFYMTFRFPKAEADQRQLHEMVEELQKDLSGVLFLALKADEALMRKENRRYQPFIRMLPIEGDGDAA